jgi:hypothetical protein
LLQERRWPLWMTALRGDKPGNGAWHDGRLKVELDYVL